MKYVSIDIFKSLRNSREFRRGKLAAFDVGSKKVGVAITDEFQRDVGPALENITRTEPRMEPAQIEKFSKKVQALISQHNIVGVVVGFPLAPDGTSTPFCQEIIDLFGAFKCHRVITEEYMNVDNKTVRKTTKMSIPYTFWDERNSTIGARRLANTMTNKKSVKIKLRDSLAASLILQGFLQGEDED